MKLRNILGVSALTLLLGVSMSSVSANASDQSVSSTVTPGNLNFQNTENSKLSGNIDLNTTGDNNETRNVPIKGSISLPFNNNTANQNGWELKLSGSTKVNNQSLKESPVFKINGSNVSPSSDNNNSSRNGGEVASTSINLNNTPTTVANTKSGAAGLGSQIFKANSAEIDLPTSNNFINSKGTTYNTTLTWSLNTGVQPSSSGNQSK